MKKLNKKYADLLHQASIATGRKEALGLLHKAAKLQTKFDEKSKLWIAFRLLILTNEYQAPFLYLLQKLIHVCILELCIKNQEENAQYKW